MPAKESVPLLSGHDRDDHVSGAQYGTIERPANVRALTDRCSEGPDHSVALPVAFLAVPSVGKMSGTLHRGLSSRQVQMIAIAGTIGTGLFLGTGRSLAQGGPASMLICYGFVSIIVYITLLLLGEMATQYPVAGLVASKAFIHYIRVLLSYENGLLWPIASSSNPQPAFSDWSFNAYATRFFSPSYGFALSWNYWFNDAVSVASDLTAAQLVLGLWNVPHPWIISLVLWVFLVGINAIHVKAYGELGMSFSIQCMRCTIRDSMHNQIEYWLSSLKVVTIVIFIVIGILVNAGVNREHHYIGGENWRIAGAPFVGGFGGFARVFVTASFAYGGTESLGITAGETKNPGKNMPKVVKFVFWRIWLFYILSVLLIGLNVPWDYPNLSNKSTTTSPFTIVFYEVGSNTAASFMNAVILTSVVSAGNHAMFAGTRVLYGLASTSPVPQAPPIFAWTTRNGVPLLALLATSSISALCFGSSFIGNGELWGWLQNLVGVSNQIAWLSIGIASWRFRKAWVKQGRPLEEMKFRVGWTWPWGPPFIIISVTALILIQGWSSIFPTFSAVDFVSFYIEIPIMIIMYLLWTVLQRSNAQLSILPAPSSPDLVIPKGRWWYTDTVDTGVVDLRRDEYVEVEEDRHEEEQRDRRFKGRLGYGWRLYYLVA
ncbi:amino acid transporter [Heterobasidion irregulare TC 32-1]|uniref:Amino acid transporter n=1 Tax=Heterobasidion irregulare (strain TC 32-1) TaxID=747525 RepID=W4K7A6_HETIT|nr:amino acid transporter [Heterobasidion irregulare TC 32-1]ETW81683.1 amino acid transporter [Heterobasidion irregulare TC 32-1]